MELIRMEFVLTFSGRMKLKLMFVSCRIIQQIRNMLTQHQQQLQNLKITEFSVAASDLSNWK